LEVSGIIAFRASGWTRHYQTFAELLQMIALLALGLAFANLRNHGPNKYFQVALVAAALLTAGLRFTAMRTVIVAFVIGASVIALRSLRATLKIVFTFALFFVLAFGAVVVWQTRDRNALCWAIRALHCVGKSLALVFRDSDSSHLWPRYGCDAKALE
jgi:carbon starvation protein CstA